MFMIRILCVCVRVCVCMCVYCHHSYLCLLLLLLVLLLLSSRIIIIIIIIIVVIIIIATVSILSYVQVTNIRGSQISKQTELGFGPCRAVPTDILGQSIREYSVHAARARHHQTCKVLIDWWEKAGKRTRTLTDAWPHDAERVFCKADVSWIM